MSQALWLTVFLLGPANGSHRREEEGRSQGVSPFSTLGDISGCGCNLVMLFASSVAMLLPVTCPHTPVSPPLLVCPSSPRGRCAPGCCLSPGCHHLCLACHSSVTCVADFLCLFLSELLVWAVFLMEPTWSRGRAFEPGLSPKPKLFPGQLLIPRPAE